MKKDELTVVGLLPTQFPEHKADEQEAIEYLLRGIPPSGGNVSRKILEYLVRAAFRGGVISVKTHQPELTL